MSTTTTRRPATVRVARWSATHPWRAIALWLVFVTASIAMGQVVGLRTMSDLDGVVGQSGQAAHTLHNAHLDEPAVENVLISPRAGTLDATAAQAATSELASRFATLPAVASVDPPRRSSDSNSLLVAVTMTGDPSTASDRVQPIVDATATVAKDYPALRIEEMGGASMNNAVNAQVGSDLGKAAIYSIPVTLIILVVAFGAIIAAGVPVLLALSAVGSAIGLSSIASQLVPDSGTTSSMILLMGMAVGVDYSLFYVKREREERARGRSHLDAIELAAETSGHSVIVSGIAVIVSMLGLFLANDPVFASLATGSILVVAVAVLGSLTVLPAVLVKLGRLVDRPRVPVLWRLTAQTRTPRFWPALLRPALKYPVRTLAVTVLALLALALPALGLKLQSDSGASLPRSIPEVQTLDRMSAAFPGVQTSQEVVVTATSQQAGVVTNQLNALIDRASSSPLFQLSGRPVIHASADQRVHEVSLDVPFDPQSSSGRQSLKLLRTELAPRTVGTISGARFMIGGETAADVDYNGHLGSRLPWVIAFVLILTMIMMTVIFRSVVVALSTVFVNLLSAGAAFGVLVLTFQNTWAQGLLGFRSTGAVVAWIPLFTFAVLFGLSMDYHVFILSRIREAVLGGRSSQDAVREGIEGSAGVVTSAAIVMVSVFAIFASLHMVEMKELGVTLAVAVLIDALVVRTLVLPSMMTMLGRWNWWPSHLSRRPDTAGLDREQLTLVNASS